MKSLKGSQTEKNILIAFSGESQARNRYTFYASQAKKDGFIFVSKIFEETAYQEKEHADACSSCSRAASWRSPAPSRPASSPTPIPT